KPVADTVPTKLESNASTTWIPTKSRINKTLSSLSSLHESFSEPNLLKTNSRLRSIAGKHFKRFDDLRSNNKNSTGSGNVGDSTDDYSADTSITNTPASNSSTSTLKKWSNSVSMRRRTASLGIASILTNHNHRDSSSSTPTSSVASINSTTLEKDNSDSDSIILTESSSLSSEVVETTPTPPPSPKDPLDFISPSLYPPNEIDTKPEHSLQTNSSFKIDDADINDQKYSPTKEKTLNFSMMQYEDDEIFSKVGPILNPPVEELNQ
ncbi:1355_t:CDS:1, partial [Racocetra persica]